MALAYRAEAEDVVRVAAPEPMPGQGRQYAALAVFDGERWASLCPDLDIASVGDTGQEAIANLIAAVREAVEVAQAEGLEPGRETPTDEILAFGRGHQGTQPAVSEAFIL